jgi:hypothetical protein
MTARRTAQLTHPAVTLQGSAAYPPRWQEPLQLLLCLLQHAHIPPVDASSEGGATAAATAAAEGLYTLREIDVSCLFSPALLPALLSSSGHALYACRLLAKLDWGFDRPEWNTSVCKVRRYVLRTVCGHVIFAFLIRSHFSRPAPIEATADCTPPSPPGMHRRCCKVWTPPWSPTFPPISLPSLHCLRCVCNQHSLLGVCVCV